MSPLRVALLGLGNVGTGVAKILLEQSDRLAQRGGRPIELRQVVVRDAEESAVGPLPLGSSPTIIARRRRSASRRRHRADRRRQADAARSFWRCSNRERTSSRRTRPCCASTGDVIFERARSLGRTVAFEAAVAGGIPIIACINQSTDGQPDHGNRGDPQRHEQFHPHRDVRPRAPVSPSLAEAQRLGYAEADPTMDVDGTDAAQKLAMLAQLAFGTKVGSARSRGRASIRWSWPTSSTPASWVTRSSFWRSPSWSTGNWKCTCSQRSCITIGRWRSAAGRST